MKTAMIQPRRTPKSVRRLKTTGKGVARSCRQIRERRQIYMGDAHVLGRRYAETHWLVPGNRMYLQSFEEYEKKHPQNKKKVSASAGP